MQLTTFAPHLATACPGVPSCPHEAPHAGAHTAVCSPSTAYCAPGRCYCEPPPLPPPPAAPRGPRWGRYGQADGELVADLMAELREHLAALRSASEGGGS